MRNKVRLGFAFVFIALTLSFTSAEAMDIPLLTWEKGKTQSVVLGVKEKDAGWEIFLSTEKSQLKFRSTSVNSAGYRVYEIFLSDRIKIGNYSITAKKGTAQRDVAFVNIVEQEAYEVVKAPWDLKIILVCFSIFMIWLLSLRELHVKSMQLPKNYLELEKIDSDSNYQINKILLIDSRIINRMRFMIIRLSPNPVIRSILRIENAEITGRNEKIQFQILFLQSLLFIFFVASWMTFSNNQVILLFSLFGFAFFSWFDLFGSVTFFGIFIFLAILSFSGDGFADLIGQVIFVSSIFMSNIIFLVSKVVRAADVNSAKNRFNILQMLYPFVYINSYVILCFYLHNSLVGELDRQLELEVLIALIASNFSGAIIKQKMARKLTSAPLELTVVPILENQPPILYREILALGLLLFGIFYSWEVPFRYSLLAIVLCLASLLTSQIQVISSKFSNRRFSNIKAEYLAIFTPIFLLGLFEVADQLPLLVSQKALVYLIFSPVIPILYSVLALFVPHSGKEYRANL